MSDQDRQILELADAMDAAAKALRNAHARGESVPVMERAIPDIELVSASVVDRGDGKPYATLEWKRSIPDFIREIATAVNSGISDGRVWR